jgi:hypothetical protein
VTGNVKNGGILAPGTSPGTLSITGNYTQDPAGILQIELASNSNYDRLPISGTVALAGSLQVSLLNNYSPVSGDTFDILSWTSETGTFSTLQLPSLGGTLGWDTSKLYTIGRLSVTTVPEPSSIALAVAAVSIFAVKFRRRLTT